MNEKVLALTDEVIVILIRKMFTTVAILGIALRNARIHIRSFERFWVFW